TEDVRRRVPPGELDRYLRFIAYWGGFPTSIGEISIPDRVFSAFDLNSALFRGRAAKEHATALASSLKPTPQQPKPPTARPKPPDDTRNSVELHWEQLFERWRSGIALPQADANQLR